MKLMYCSCSNRTIITHQQCIDNVRVSLINNRGDSQYGCQTDTWQKYYRGLDEQVTGISHLPAISRRPNLIVYRSDKLRIKQLIIAADRVVIRWMLVKNWRKWYNTQAARHLSTNRGNHSVSNQPVISQEGIKMPKDDEIARKYHQLHVDTSISLHVQSCM